MKPQISITIEPDKVGIQSPFNPRNNDRFRATGGKFSAGQWNFANTPATAAMIDQLFGSAEDFVLIRVDLDDRRVEARDGVLVLGGYVLANRRGRDYRVNVADGVQLYSGNFQSSGGSMKNPRVTWDGTVLLDALVRRDFAVRIGFEPIVSPTASPAANASDVQEQAGQPVEPDEARRRQIVQLTDDQNGRDGEIEFDDDAKISESDDNGAYVQAWVWVDFSGTPFDKEKEESVDEDLPAKPSA